MSNTRATIVLGCCLALVACDRSTSNPTAPVSRSTASADVLPSSLTPIGLADPIAALSTAGLSAAAATTGGRASGHADVTQFGLDEAYSFTALSIAATKTETAKGEMEGTISFGTNNLELHVDVNCLSIAGNTAWVGGLTTRFVVNGVTQPNFEMLWEVRDNGEGANSPPDEASVLYFAFPQACRSQFDLAPTPSQNGNIQVSQK
jgi:hypothetical protein